MRSKKMVSNWHKQHIKGTFYVSEIDTSLKDFTEPHRKAQDFGHISHLFSHQ